MSESCPTTERWKEHLEGSLPAGEQTSLTEHLDHCASCRHTLEMLAGGSESLLDVARQAKDAPKTASPALQGILEHWQGPPTETQAEPSVVGDDGLAFLTPSEKPGFLGRLGHYEVQQVLGRGGFGIVLKAFDEKLHRVVAIKVLSPAYAASGAAGKRFIREARAAAAVKNEHVVAIYNVQDEAHPPYLVMELIDGISLQDKLDRKGPLDVKEVLRIGLQAAEGLAAAHKQGLVHRDIKPANILLENGVERVKITDFGLARAVDDASVTQSGTVAGTPMYMSPEQADGLAIDHRSDLFSLGTVLYVMCTGHPPFRASSTHAVLKRVIDDKPRPIREINPDIPDWLDAIVAKLHAKRPEDRFPSAKEVADLLSQHLAHLQQPKQVAQPARVRVPASGESAAAEGFGSILGGFLYGVCLFALCFVLFGAILYPLATLTQWPVRTILLMGSALAGCLALSLWGLSVVVRRWQRPGWARSLEQAAGLCGVLALLLGVVGLRNPTPGRSSEDTIPLQVKEQLPGEPGWVPLFNGKNLEGWHTIGGNPGAWSVENGILRAAGSRSYLVSDRSYRDFHLKAEARMSPGATLGVLFRTDRIAANARDRSPQGMGAEFTYERPVGDVEGRIQMEIQLIWNGNSLARAVENLKPHDWFPIEITTQSDGAGIKISGAGVGASQLTQPFKAGPIILRLAQDNAVLEFRKIEIKDLSAPTVPPLALAPFDADKARAHQEAWAKHLGVEIERTNSLGMKFRLIPPGEFTMGTRPEDVNDLVPVGWEWARPSTLAETPTRKVQIPKAFYLGTTEVTVGQFKKFVEAKGYQTVEERDGLGGLSYVNGKIDRRPEYIWRHPDVSQSDDHPIGQVTAADAEAFCAWLSTRDGFSYQLPDEEHWEYASRAGTQTLWSCGNDPADLERFAWVGGPRDFRSQPVGKKLANPFGLFDMHGNVEETCRAPQGGYTSRSGHGGLHPLLTRSASRAHWAGGETGSYRQRGFRVAIVGNLKPKAPTEEQ